MHTPNIGTLSDIDDTIELLGILTSAQAVFLDLFNVDLKEGVILQLPSRCEWSFAFSNGHRS